jgi:tartrate dehydratase alpha subunit/fumarate hydratase class I-like protein
MYASIRKNVEVAMKRTTVFVDEDVLRKLREIAKRENSSVAEVTRKTLVAVPCASNRFTIFGRESF